MVLKFKAYQFIVRSARYRKEVDSTIRKAGKRMTLQMKGYTLSCNDPVAIPGFLQSLKTACDQNGVSEGAAFWCFQVFLTGPALSSNTQKS